MSRPRIALLVLILAWIGWDSFYVVEEGELCIVTRFGEYQVSRLAPGPYPKAPMADTIVRMQRRILVSNAPQAEYLTLDKKKLVADPITRWRITKPITYYKTVKDESGAKARIDDIVNSELRAEIASHEFGSIIGNRRQPMMDSVAQKARAKVAEFGIELVDVQIKRADLPNEVQESVFLRMRAERVRIANRYRSEGEEEAQKIRAQTDKEKVILLAKAYEKAQVMIGDGDAQSVAVYAEAYGKDADFYALVRSLEAYEASLDDKTHVVLSTGSEFLRYVDSPR